MKTAEMNPMTQIMDITMENLKTLTWAQEQGEKAVIDAIEQNKKARAEGMKIVERFAEQANKNQAAMQKYVEDSVKATQDSMKRFQEQQQAVMTKQMEMFQAQVDRASKVVAATGKA